MPVYVKCPRCKAEFMSRMVVTSKAEFAYKFDSLEDFQVCPFCYEVITLNTSNSYWLEKAITAEDAVLFDKLPAMQNELIKSAKEQNELLKSVQKKLVAERRKNRIARAPHLKRSRIYKKK